jgi:meso-butanediol dehydrogenase / (S,S)-butanediol dehydrogenase / diacetyl reductase
MNIRGSNVIVTGAARGIGRGIAEAFVREGARVVLADLGAKAASQEWAYGLAGGGELEATAADLRSRGGEVVAVACDVTDAASCRVLVDQARAAFGGVDVLVNNAGVVKVGPLLAIEEADWDRMMAVNAKGVLFCSQAAVPAMLERGSGTVVNIASMAARQGFAGLAAYCASKFAVLGLTQSMAMELAPFGVRVNAVCPGLLATAMWIDHLSVATSIESGKSPGREAFEDYVVRHTPLGREQTAADVAEAALYLVRADNVTGTALDVNGGAAMR